MLSAFKAQPIHEFKASDKVKIESLLAYGDRLLVGLSNGALRIYRINDTEQAAVGVIENGDEQGATRVKSDQLRELDKFSKRPVQQLAIVKESNLLVSLSDGYISLHDLQTYELVERLEPTKNATCFTVASNIVKDPEADIPSLVSRLAVGVKRKVLCWKWLEMEQMPDIVEISLESTVKSLVWAAGSKLVVGMDPGFCVVDAETREVTPVNKPASRAVAEAKAGESELSAVRFGAVSSSGMGYMGMSSWVPKPMATPLFGGQILLAKDVNTLFVDPDGHALDKRQVPWSLAPEAVGYSYPYLLGLQPRDRGSLQIRNPDTLSLLQTIAVPEATILHVPQPNISLAHAGKGFLVASDRVIWRMNALGYDAQLIELTEKQRFDEAISLLKLLEDTLIDDKAGRIREIMTQKATMLFQEQKYELALDNFTQAETSPQRVIALYPSSIAGNLAGTSGEQLPEEAIEESKGKADTSSKEPPSTPSKSFFDRVTGGRARSGSTVSNETPSPRRRPTSRSNGYEQKSLEGDELITAVRGCLQRFLPQARKQIQKYLSTDGILKENPPSLDSETNKPAFANLLPASVFDADDWKSIDWQGELLRTAGLVDTTLFRCYMLASPSLAGPLFRIDNFCDADVVRTSLYESGRYSDLIDFLHGKKLHRQALEMLARFGKGEAEGEIPKDMRGPERTVGYLKQLPPSSIQLILEFAKWPVSTRPDVGMDVFLADTENAENLPRDGVLEFLANEEANLEQQYLEHIITELADPTAKYHQRLIDLYLRTLKDPAQSDDHAENQTRLETLLAQSEVYDRAATLRQLPDDEPTFYESRALVLSAMGRHREALSIYVFQLHDYPRAEEYCTTASHAQQAAAAAKYHQLGSRLTRTNQSTVADPDVTSPSDSDNIFAILLGLYLRPPGEETKRWPQALDLLSRHGARLPASSTLALMPDDLEVKQLDDYFRGRLRTATARRRQDRIVHGLEEMRNKAVERHLLLGTDAEIAQGTPGGRSRRVRIGEGDVCPVCHRRFGTSAVRVYPDGRIVHYGCVDTGGTDERKGVRREWG